MIGRPIGKTGLSVRLRALAIVGCLLAVATVGGVPAVAAADGCDPGPPPDQFHCYSEAIENTDLGSYTGARELRVVQNLNLNYSNWVFTTMWMTFAVPGTWVEIGTAYGGTGEWDFAYACPLTGCHYLYFSVTQQTPGEHAYKIDREVADHYTYDLLVDGVPLTAPHHTSWSHGAYIHTGLEAYVDVHFPTYASYGLKYKTGDGSYQNWAGQDDHGPINAPMCGKWHSDTSWWAGEHDSCV